MSPATSRWLRCCGASAAVLLVWVGGCSGDAGRSAGESSVVTKAESTDDGPTDPEPTDDGPTADHGPVDDERTDDGITVLRPGEPGEPAETVGPDDVPPAPQATHSDIAFVQMMVPHHAQALEIARLAPSRAAHGSVKALARRIEGAQGPEILELAAWLEAHGIEVPRAGEDPQEYDHSRHGHAAMAGMLTDAQMRRLAASSGRRFDTLFLQGMIRHHLGAVQMAETVAIDGADIRVSEIAADVATGQRAEVDRMRDLLRRL